MPDDTNTTTELSPEDLAALTDPLDNPAAEAGVRHATSAEIILGDNAFDAELHLTAADDHTDSTTIALRLSPATVRDLHQQLLEVHRAQRSAAGIAANPDHAPSHQEHADVTEEERSDQTAPPERQPQRFLNPLGPLLDRVTGTKKAQAAAVLILVLLLLAWAVWRVAQ